MKVVCIIDDEPSIRKGIANLLKSEGYQPVCFESGSSFLASPWKAQADCLLLDLRMQGMQGRDVQRALQAQGNPLPVICMSAHASEHAIQQVLRAGASHFLGKPFTAEALLQVIAMTLQDQP
jgi:FixJ family two-component response regulator